MQKCGPSPQFITWTTFLEWDEVTQVFGFILFGCEFRMNESWVRASREVSHCCRKPLSFKMGNCDPKRWLRVRLPSVPYEQRKASELEIQAPKIKIMFAWYFWEKVGFIFLLCFTPVILFLCQSIMTFTISYKEKYVLWVQILKHFSRSSENVGTSPPVRRWT